ncbi:AI-2E family transporter [Jeotgalibacillus sp. JSM ZJ347]|uniref:AI-2E family transporter n=1 Tax=Jeotgalibacillus sp. JSM ZJ347 TaxID=3342117 RepID=UPI0035A983EC
MIKRCIHVLIITFFILFISRIVLIYLLPFIIGALLSILLYPIIRLLFEYVKLPYKLSVLLGIIACMITGPLMLYGCFILLKNELVYLLTHLPHYTTALLSLFQHTIQNFPAFLHDLTHPYLTHGHLSTLIEEIEQLLLESGKQLITGTSKFAGNLPSYIFSIGIMLIAAYYILSDFKSWQKKLPDKWIEQFGLIRELGLKEAGSYFLSQILLSVFTFIITLTGLLILGTPHPFLFALLSAALDFVPLAGSLLLFLPLSVFYLVQADPLHAAGAAVIYVAVVLVRQVAEPKIIGDRMGLHPLAALMVLYTSVNLLGLKGLILTPFFMIVISVLMKIRLFPAIWRYIATGEHPFIKH